jgi:hypothetical protein
MRLDTVTIVLSGDVPLMAFAKAIARFDALVRGLSGEVGAPELEWVIDDLERSSALATARGVGDPERITQVVQAYGKVGKALEGGVPLAPHSRPVQNAAQGLRAIVGGKVESIRLETAEGDATIRAASSSLRLVTPGDISRPMAAAYGAIEGRVQTLSNRGGLRFTLYDLLHDRAVSSYLQEGHEEIMRDSWGKVVVVEGWISRDPLTGRPTTIRQVTTVRVAPELKASYRDARSISPPKTDLLPEQAIRRLRNV